MKKTDVAVRWNRNKTVVLALSVAMVAATVPVIVSASTLDSSIKTDVASNALVTTVASTSTATTTTTSRTTKKSTTTKKATTTITTTTTTTATTAVLKETVLVNNEVDAAEYTEDIIEYSNEDAVDSSDIQDDEVAMQSDVSSNEIQTASENGWVYSITDEEYIMLCNTVAHEYGSDWVSTEEKAKVAEVVLNRVASPNYPNSVREVLLQPNQFSGASSFADIGSYSWQVTESVKEAVDYQLTAAPNHGYTGFWGDGTMNHFY